MGNCEFIKNRWMRPGKSMESARGEELWKRSLLEKKKGKEIFFGRNKVFKKSFFARILAFA